MVVSRREHICKIRHTSVRTPLGSHNQASSECIGDCVKRSIERLIRFVRAESHEKLRFIID